jgi:hypothetical protein
MCQIEFSPSAMIGHTHSAYTHFSGTALSGYNIEVLKIIRDRRLHGGRDEITGQLIDQSGQRRASVPFTLTTHDSHFTDPLHLGGIFAALQKQLAAGASHITVIYPDAVKAGSDGPCRLSSIPAPASSR